MDQPLYENIGDPQVAVPNVRRDQDSHAIVEQGILMQQDGCTVSAFEYLKARGVAPEVIRRVLLEPQRRRARDESFL